LFQARIVHTQHLRQNRCGSGRPSEFTILTAAWSGEVLGATWSEIDLKARIAVTSAYSMHNSQPETLWMRLREGYHQDRRSRNNREHHPPVIRCLDDTLAFDQRADGSLRAFIRQSLHEQFFGRTDSARSVDVASYASALLPVSQRASA